MLSARSHSAKHADRAFLMNWSKCSDEIRWIRFRRFFEFSAWCWKTDESGQIIIFHQPRFPWNSRGFPLVSYILGEIGRVRSLQFDWIIQLLILFGILWIFKQPKSQVSLAMNTSFCWHLQRKLWFASDLLEAIQGLPGWWAQLCWWMFSIYTHESKATPSPTLMVNTGWFLASKKQPAGKKYINSFQGK